MPVKKKNSSIKLNEEIIISKIYLIRNKKVMIDRDLAEIYSVETKRLKEAVKRNRTRFPEDFMFEMTTEELKIGGRNLRPPILPTKWVYVTRHFVLPSKVLICFQAF